MDTIETIQNLLKFNGSARVVTVALTPNELRLIAAAPDLLYATQYVRNLIGPDSVLDAAIAKATGEQP